MKNRFFPGSTFEIEMNYRDQIYFAWYKHVIFWVAYVLFWSIQDLVHHAELWDNFRLNLISGFLHAGLVYFNIYVLVPGLLLKKKPLSFLLAFMASISLTAFLNSQTTAFYLNFYDLGDVAKFFTSMRGVIVLHFEAVFVSLITLAIILSKIYFVKDNQSRELIKKNLETELNFLKNQINPHFLFNSLNSIYFLIPKNPKKAADVLLKFSDMLSHQLYQGNKDFIPLQNEIKYLEDYIELERVRQGDRVNIAWSVDGQVNGHQVAPMILLTFLENAFKHGQQINETYGVDGSITILEDRINFILKNDRGTNGDAGKNNGVGLDNTKRRLELLYPARHELKIDESDDTFVVDLTIMTHEN